VSTTPDFLASRATILADYEFYVKVFFGGNPKSSDDILEMVDFGGGTSKLVLLLFYLLE